MTVIKINAITVPAGAGEELVNRFAARAGAVDGAEGFEGFELLRPTDGRDVFLVVTRWRDDASFEAWRSGAAFAQGHAGQAAQAGGHPGAGHPGGAPSADARPPVSTQAELWAYEVVELRGTA